MSASQTGTTLPSQTTTTPLGANETYSSPLVGVAEFGTLNIHLKSDQDCVFEVMWRNDGNNDQTSGGIIEFKVADSPDGVITQFPVAGTSFQYELTTSSTPQTLLLVSVFASYFPYFPPAPSSSSMALSAKIPELCYTAAGDFTHITDKIDVSQWVSLSISTGRFPSSTNSTTSRLRVQFFEDDGGGTEREIVDWEFSRNRSNTVSGADDGGNYWHVPVCGSKVILTFTGSSSTGTFGTTYGSLVPVGNAFMAGALPGSYP